MGIILGRWEMVMAMVPGSRNMEIIAIEIISNISNISHTEDRESIGNMNMKAGAMANIAGMMMIDIL
jgi:hypothetical protein